MNFAEMIPDSVWQHATCPVILLVGIVLLTRAAGQLARALLSVEKAVGKLESISGERTIVSLPPPSKN